MPTQAFPVNCDGGLVLDKSVFVAKPGEAVTLQNYEPSVTGGYSKILRNGNPYFSERSG